MLTKTIDLTIPEQEIEILEDTELVGLYVGRDDQQLKSKIKFIHRKPHLISRINIKAVVYDQAKFDMEAMMLIDDGAKGTDSYLKIDALVMSDQGRARAVPSLEIKEDDVKGGHGATVGQVDQNQIHYIMSRGFGRTVAEQLLVEAFISDVREKIDANK